MWVLMCETNERITGEREVNPKSWLDRMLGANTLCSNRRARPLRFTVFIHFFIAFNGKITFDSSCLVRVVNIRFECVRFWIKKFNYRSIYLLMDDLNAHSVLQPINIRHFINNAIYIAKINQDECSAYVQNLVVSLWIFVAFSFS